MLFSPLSTLFHVLAASASVIAFVAAQKNQTEMITTDDLYAKISPDAAPPGFNVEGGSVFQNFVNAFNNKQMFYLVTGSFDFEMPGSEPVSLTLLHWCSDLTFSDFNNSSLMGYAGRCVSMLLAGYAGVMAAGTQLAEAFSEGEFTSTRSVSAVFVEQLNVFGGQIHDNTDDWVVRYWDSGMKTAPMNAWEGHDEGDMDPNAATSSWSFFGDLTWVPVEEVAQLFNTSTDEFTPETFNQVYENTWIKEHEQEAAESNPNAEAELEIVEEVQNETDSTGETTSPAAPETAEDGGTDASAPVEEDSGSRRHLTSVAARFVSAALRVFGI